MTEETDTAGTPIACSLGAAEQSFRRARWHALLSTGRPAAAAVGHGVILPRPLAAEAFRLVLAEQDCCPFFSFSLVLTVGELCLAATAPESATILLDELFGRQRDPRAEGSVVGVDDGVPLAPADHPTVDR